MVAVVVVLLMSAAQAVLGSPTGTFALAKSLISCVASALMAPTSAPAVVMAEPPRAGESSQRPRLACARASMLTSSLALAVMVVAHTL
jgi:hypothetical protein